MRTKHIARHIFRCFIFCSLLFFVACSSEEPQPVTIPLIGIVAPLVGLEDTLYTIKTRLAEEGLIIDKTIRIQIIDSKAINIDTLLKAQPKLILSFFTGPTHRVLERMKEAKVSIPVLFGGVSDPVSSHLVEDPDKPTLVTGVSVGDWQGRSLSRVTSLFPRIRQIIVPLSEKTAETKNEMSIMEEASDVAGVSLKTIRYSKKRGILSILKRISPHTDFIWILRASQDVPKKEELIKEALAQRIGIFGPQTNWCTAGALVCVGPDPSLLGKQLAEMATQIVHGKPISEIPVEPVRLFAVVNADAARRIGISVTPEVRSQADLVIE